MVGHLVLQSQAAKPTIRQIEMHFVTKATFRTNAHHITNHQHPDDELGINRRATCVGVERLQPFPHVSHVEKAVNLSQDMVGWQMRVQIELIKQLRFNLLNAHHR